jgi:hypothetical protein
LSLLLDNHLGELGEAVAEAEAAVAAAEQDQHEEVVAVEEVVEGGHQIFQ